jgi:spoIIIJ-associated protein
VSEQTDERHEVEEALTGDSASKAEEASEVQEADEAEGAGEVEGADEVDGPDPADDTHEADETEESSSPAAGSSPRVDQLEAEGDIAADYLEELLDIADLDGDLDMDVEGDRAAVSIVGAQLSQLVGSEGEVLEALQELTRLAVYRETGERSRLMLDISGYRADKRTELEKLADETVARVKESGEPAPLDPMTPFERKVVHDAVAAAGLTSESEGVEPRRFVVVLPQ